MTAFADADQDAVAHFNATGWLLTRTLDEDGVASLRRWVDESSSRPDDAGDWLHYRELTDDGPKLCRTENFVPFHDACDRSSPPAP